MTRQSTVHRSSLTSDGRGGPVELVAMAIHTPNVW
jgi:hypothetical protein